MHHPTDRIIHTTAFVTPVVEHWLERDYQKHRVRHKTENTILVANLANTGQPLNTTVQLTDDT